MESILKGLDIFISHITKCFEHYIIFCDQWLYSLLGFKKSLQNIANYYHLFLDPNYNKNSKKKLNNFCSVNPQYLLSISLLFLITILLDKNLEITAICLLTVTVATNHRMSQIFKAFCFHHKPKNDKVFVF